MKISKKNKGIALVEVVIASSIMFVVVLATSVAYNAYLQYALLNQHEIQANFLLEEGVEAVSFIRDGGFGANIATLSTATTYYLYFNDTITSWQATTTPQYVDGQFLRSFVLTNALRDSNDDIASSGAVDTNTKKVDVSVSYFAGHATTTKTLSTYIANINSD